MLENCFQCPRFFGKNACEKRMVSTAWWLLRGEEADLDDEERVLGDGLEELAQDEVDERDEVLI